MSLFLVWSSSALEGPKEDFSKSGADIYRKPEFQKHSGPGRVSYRDKHPRFSTLYGNQSLTIFASVSSGLPCLYVGRHIATERCNKSNAGLGYVKIGMGWPNNIPNITFVRQPLRSATPPH
jgi:hypothetical protein